MRTAWPDFFLVGAAKAGTTALHAALRRHPEVFVPRQKSPRYFAFVEPPAFRDAAGRVDLPVNRHAVTGASEYLALFRHARSGQVRGDCSDLYLYAANVATRIHARSPDARILVVLRDPVERAFAAWCHMRREGREPLDLGAALRAEPERIRAGFAPMYHYVARGRYLGQIEAFLRVFRRGQVGVYLYEELRDRPGVLLPEIYRFLGVDPRRGPTRAPRLNVSGEPRGAIGRAVQAIVRPPAPVRRLFRRLPAPLRERLVAGRARADACTLKKPAFEAHVRESLRGLLLPELADLERVIDRDLSAWRR